MTLAPSLPALPCLDWTALAADLDDQGWARLPGLIPPAGCAALAALYDEAERFRARVVMARHGFGQGEYRYFAYPLPPPVLALRHGLYPPLARIANRWEQRLGGAARYPATLAEFLAACHAAGQARPTPLLLRYGPGDYNRLHQDLHGDLAFPLQVALLLARPGRDFDGGEFVLGEQRPRRQSRVTVVPLAQGDAVVFATRWRPVEGHRGWHRAQLRHGVSTLRAGQRTTLGLVFHDAR